MVLSHFGHQPPALFLEKIKRGGGRRRTKIIRPIQTFKVTRALILTAVRKDGSIMTAWFKRRKVALKLQHHYKRRVHILWLQLASLGPFAWAASQLMTCLYNTGLHSQPVPSAPSLPHSLTPVQISRWKVERSPNLLHRKWEICLRKISGDFWGKLKGFQWGRPHFSEGFQTSVFNVFFCLPTWWENTQRYHSRTNHATPSVGLGKPAGVFHPLRRPWLGLCLKKKYNEGIA